MSEQDMWTRLLLVVLATWRLTHLLAYEDGPADVLVRVRSRLGRGAAGRFLDCFYCLSFWVAAVFTLSVTRKLLDFLLTAVAVSGAACLLERLGKAPSTPTFHEREIGDQHDGMLWAETDAVIEDDAEGSEHLTKQLGSTQPKGDSGFGPDCHGTRRGL